MTADRETGKKILHLVDKIRTQYQPSKIILFGSHAYGNPHGDSDVDLLIIKDTDARPIDRRVAVREILSDPGRRFPVEIIVMTPREVRERLDIGDMFLKEILEKGEILYAA